MVYLASMKSALAALLLVAGSAEGQTPAETPPAQGLGPIPEATAPQQPPKPGVPSETLKILGQDMRIEAYQQFRTLYEANQFEAALPYAKQVVELSEHGEDPDYELPVAYNNLGATQYQIGDYAGAADSYSKSLDLLEATQGISSRRLVVPLAGLGAVYAAQDQHELAATLYERALAVSRRADGLFNLQQVPLLRQAADSRFAMSDFAGAEREHMYALKIAEQNYGYGDPRTIPSLLDFGRFYEGLREYVAARLMYMRARDAALAVKPGFSPDVVAALTGISRCHPLFFSLNPDPADMQPQRDEFTGEITSKIQDARVPSPSADRTGLKAAQQALDLLRATPEPPPEMVTQVLVELGDWFQTLSKPGQSMPYYIEAAALLDGRSAQDPLTAHPLREPRMVFYRPPAGAIRKINPQTTPYVVRKTVFSFLVTEAGVPQDITIVSTDMNDAQLMLSRRAISRAIYSPRFSEGKAVATAGVTFTGEWFDTSVEAAPQPSAEDAAAKPAAETKPADEPASGSGAGGRRLLLGSRLCGRGILGRLFRRRRIVLADRPAVFRRLVVGGRRDLRRRERPRRRLQRIRRLRRRGRQRAAGAAQQEAHRFLVGQLDGDLGAGVAHRALRRERERLLVPERTRFLAPVARERERIHARARAVIDRQKVADRDDVGLAGDVLRRQEGILLEPRLEHEGERRRDRGDLRGVLHLHDLAEHRAQQPVEVDHMRRPEADRVVHAGARFLVHVLAEFLRVVDADAHRQLLEQRRRQCRARLELGRGARREGEDAEDGGGRPQGSSGHDFLRRNAVALPSGSPTKTPPLRALRIRMSVA